MVAVDSLIPNLAADISEALRATLRCCPVLVTEPEGRLAAIVDRLSLWQCQTSLWRLLWLHTPRSRQPITIPTTAQQGQRRLQLRCHIKHWLF